jgi:hypothetical protein
MIVNYERKTFIVLATGAPFLISGGVGACHFHFYWRALIYPENSMPQLHIFRYFIYDFFATLFPVACLPALIWFS